MSGPLKPCPFCGSDCIERSDADGKPRDYWWTMCDDCGVTTEEVYPDQAASDAVWNRRVAKVSGPQDAQALQQALGVLCYAVINLDKNSASLSARSQALAHAAAAAEQAQPALTQSAPQAAPQDAESRQAPVRVLPEPYLRLNGVKRDARGRKTSEVELMELYSADQMHAFAAAEASSRAMFVARLENEAAQGRTTISVVDVLALLNDCDYCASMEKSTTPLK